MPWRPNRLVCIRGNWKILSETCLWFSHAGLCLSQNADVKHRWLSVWVLRLRRGCWWPLALACSPLSLPCLPIAPEICLPLVSKASQVLQISCSDKVGKASVQPVIEMLMSWDKCFSLLLLREHSFTFLHKQRERSAVASKLQGFPSFSGHYWPRERCFA